MQAARSGSVMRENCAGSPDPYSGSRLGRAGAPTPFATNSRRQDQHVSDPLGEGRILAVFAHPDDESIVAGGTLAACARAGYDISILSATRGEQGPISHAELATRETLG